MLNRFGYVWVAIALVLVAAGMRVVGVVAVINVFRGLPKNRTSIGAALTDPATEVTSGVGIAVSGTLPVTGRRRTAMSSRKRRYIADSGTPVAVVVVLLGEVLGTEAVVGRTGYVVGGVAVALIAWWLLPGWVTLLIVLGLIAAPVAGYLMLDPSQRRRLRGQARKRLGS
ncbi:hypothetical protein GCM10023195_41590 [Actinoallomurus liliacearum]|uniref:Uncharacterized protein n=1 Tax=Actinoallomurus liliacearum TaxID=1080073 RepID=A0ABP8TP71_9ACTN